MPPPPGLPMARFSGRLASASISSSMSGASTGEALRCSSVAGSPTGTTWATRAFSWGGRPMKKLRRPRGSKIRAAMKSR